MSDIEKFFHPKSIAVVGASPTPGKVGNAVLSNILYSEPSSKDRVKGFSGEVYPINPKYKEILGLSTYSSILDVPGDVDLAVLIIPGKAIPAVLEECGEKGCRNAIIISAGFAEHGEDGKIREKEIIDISKRNGIRIIGPNCLGIFSTFENLNASFAQEMPQCGPISMISQSGALVTAIIAYASQEHIGFSNFVSSGNKADVDDIDLIEYFNDDPRTNSIAIYMESIKDGRKFYETAKRVSLKTPIVMMKVGRTEAGRKAASSHTGALAGVDWAYEAAFRQAGVYRVECMDELFDAARALAYQPVPKGDRIVVLTNAGGPGVIASDAAYQIGLPMAELNQSTIDKLDAVCPPSWSRSNPVDIIGDADVDRFVKSLGILLKASEVDGVILIMAPTMLANPLELAHRVADMAQATTKPIIASFVGMVREASEDFLESTGVPTIEFPERAVLAMHALVHRMCHLKGPGGCAYVERVTSSERIRQPSSECREIFRSVRESGRNLLTLNEARKAFESFGIPMNPSGLATNEKEAARIGKELGFPVAMKISSPDVVHKTDVGGVMVDVRNPQEARAAFGKILDNVRSHMPDARIEGVVIDAMVRGPELIIGVTSDPQFGPMVMFGLGGIMVEAARDVSFRLVPLTHADAWSMTQEIRGKLVFMGARGMPKANLDELADLIVKVSEAVQTYPEIAELDINPLVVTENSLLAVDARVLIKGND